MVWFAAKLDLFGNTLASMKTNKVQVKVQRLAIITSQLPQLPQWLFIYAYKYDNHAQITTTFDVSVKTENPEIIPSFISFPYLFPTQFTVEGLDENKSVKI